MNKEHLENLESEILSGLVEIESLEARKTPAVTTFGVVVGILTLNFDGANDTVIVSKTTTPTTSRSTTGKVPKT